MSSRVFKINEVGDVLFRHSYKARYLSISMKPFIGVRVSVPVGMSYSSAVRMVNGKKSWIIQHLNKMKEFEKQQTIFNEHSDYCTKSRKLYLKQADRKNISVRLSEGKINVLYPTELNSDSREVQNAIRKGIERALKIEAKLFLPDRVKSLASKFSFKFNKLSLKNIKSRWGSCSRNNNINLSVHLMRLPAHLIEYVILHELAHTIHHNHSPHFWNLLNDITGNAKLLDKELRNYRISIY
ncbi:MAG: SprT family zinc-dependent metalloprotease [Ignavibacteriaceae bacterium]